MPCQLLIVSSDTDVVVVSNDSCVDCYNVVHRGTVLHVLNTVADQCARDIIHCSGNRPISFKCRKLCKGGSGSGSSEALGSPEHMLTISLDREQYYGMHWLVLRQVQRRRNKRWMHFHEDNLKPLPEWYDRYYDEYVEGTTDIEHKFAVDFRVENQPNPPWKRSA